MSVRRILKRLFTGAAKIGVCLTVIMLIALAVLWQLCPFPREKPVQDQSGGSALILDRRGGMIAWRVDSSDSWRLPVGVDDVSPWLVKATLAAEDRRFESHPGVDPLAVARAACRNVSSRRRVSGASTITMQAIRLLWPRPRTYSSKLIETFRAVQLDSLMSKPEILRLYLNCAPYGGNVIGAEAAARRYFGKSATDLTLGEAALLAGIPQRPARFNPNNHLDRALHRREFVMEQLGKHDIIGKADIAAAQRERIRVAPIRRRTEAERFADLVILLYGRDGGTLHTTLDPETQATVRDCVRTRARGLRDLGIDGIAAVVVDVDSSELVAMIGSGDPSDSGIGYVNCAAARRQPGSLLKPFVYAAAYDRGVLTPQSVVYDVPTVWRGYRPENMDKQFKGPMSAARALHESRNLPAVRLLAKLSVERLARDINRLGLGIQEDKSRFGLSMALGTPEVRLLDIANAYAALARLGEYRPLTVVQEDTPCPTQRVYSHAASYLTLRSLGAAKPGEPVRPAWKTGTSWKRRDAWAVVVTPEHVTAVWCGRVSGEGHPELVGARTALPTAQEITERIWKSTCTTWERPPEVAIRRVCSLSGAPPGSWCTHEAESEYIPGVSGDTPCGLHRRCRITWPADVASFLASRHAGSTASRTPSMQILSPIDGGEYVLASLETSASRNLEFAARVPLHTESVYWFLNGEFCGTSGGREPFPWPMDPGMHELIASDGSGASSRVSFTVLRP